MNKNKIVRRPDFAGGGITEEEKIRMAAHTKRWVDLAFRTDPIDPDKIVPAIKGLYRVSGLKEPRVVIVRSPFVMALVGGFAAAIWWMKKNPNNPFLGQSAMVPFAADATGISGDAIFGDVVASSMDFYTLEDTFHTSYGVASNAIREATYNAVQSAVDYAVRVAATKAAGSVANSITGNAILTPTDTVVFNVTNDATQRATKDTMLADHRAVFDSTDNAVHYATVVATSDTIDAVVSEATIEATRNATDTAVREATRNVTNVATYYATDDAVRNATFDATDDATYAATDPGTHDATEFSVREATIKATRNATNAAVRRATFDATDDATLDATEYYVRDATIDETKGATNTSVREAILDATEISTVDSVYAATTTKTYSAVQTTYYSTYKATFDATDEVTQISTNNIIQVHDGTRSATIDSTGDAVYLDIRDIKSDSTGDPYLHLVDFLLKCAANWVPMYQGGNMWASWDCYLTAARDILGLQLPSHEKYAWWEQCAVHGGFRIMHEEFCVVTDFPEYIKIDSQNRPHCEDGPSHRWRDGWSVYHLNGVRVPAWLVETKAQDLDPGILTKIDNAEVRREFVRKVGAERIVSTLSEGPIDKRSYKTKDGRIHPYELHRLRVSPEEEWTYLRMVNPSVDLVHFEGVPNECRTVQEAINFRAGLRAEQVTDDGADYIQQGDVLLFPQGATKFKPFPSVLT